MSQLRTSMIIDLAGNLAGRANQFLGSMQRLGSGGSRSMQILQRSVHAAGQGLDRLGNRYTAILSGAAGVGAIKQVGDLSQRMTQLRLDANMTAEQVERLKQKVFEVAQMQDIRVDPAGLFSGVAAIVSKSGDWNLAEGQIRNIGLAMRAAGSDGEAIGAIISDLNKKMKISPDEMLQALTVIREAGKAGSFEMKDFVSQGPRIAAAMANTGRVGVSGLKEMMAIMQVFRSSAGSPEEATTAFKNFFADLIEPSKKKILDANNIQIFDPEALGKGKYKWRSPIDIMDEIIKKSHGDPRKWGQLLGMQTRDGFNAVMAEWQATGTNPMRSFLKVSDDPKQLLDEAAIAAKEFNAAIQNLNTSWQRFASTELTEPIKNMADYLNNLEPGTVQRWLNMAKYAAIIGGGLLVAAKGFKAYQFGRDLLTGGKGGGGPLPGGAVPVRVTNLPGGGYDPLTNTRPVPASKPRIGGMIGTAGIIALPAITALSARPIGRALAESEVQSSSIERLQQLLSKQVVMGGGPHSYQAQLIAKELERRGALNVSGTIKIQIDSEGRPKLKMLAAHDTKVNLEVDTGLVMRSSH